MASDRLTRVEARPGRTGTARLRRLIDARYGDERGKESELERWFARLCRQLGYPVPDAQVKIVDENGVEIMRADFGLGRIKEAFELDSKRHHATAKALTADRVKRRRARQIGWKVNEYTDEIMRRQPLLIAEDLRDAYERLERFEQGLWLPPSCEDERRRAS